jgi:hypothetical protein
MFFSIFLSVLKTTYDEDFPLIVEKKQLKKQQKKQRIAEMNLAADKMSSKTYDLMISSIDDLISGY